MVSLFKVEERFQITGRGCVLVPGIPQDPTLPAVRIRDKIVLVRPDGSRLSTHVEGIEMINYRSKPRVVAAPILLPREFTIEDVPRGTEVFLATANEPNA